MFPGPVERLEEKTGHSGFGPLLCGCIVGEVRLRCSMVRWDQIAMSESLCSILTSQPRPAGRPAWGESWWCGWGWWSGDGDAQ